VSFFLIMTDYFWKVSKLSPSMMKIALMLMLRLEILRGEKNLVFAEPAPWVDDSKNIWVPKFHQVFQAFWVLQRQKFYKRTLYFHRIRLLFRKKIFYLFHKKKNKVNTDGLLISIKCIWKILVLQTINFDNLHFFFGPFLPIPPSGERSSSDFIFQSSKHAPCQLPYACTLFWAPPPFSHHSCLVKFAQIK